MTGGVEALAWDTEFFGFPVGRVSLDGADAQTLAKLDDDARDLGLLCLYGSLDPIDAQTSYLVQQHGYRFVDAATTFDLKLHEPPIPQPPGVSVRLGDADDLPGMADMITKLGDWSRFAVDPRFGPEVARRMQAAWIERAATCGTGEYQLVVAEDDTGIIAFISRAAEPHPVVDTVGTTAQGSGAARYLIEDARSWAGDKPLLGGPIAARNVNALRYVSHCNYRVCKVRYLYHRWLDEPPGERT
jgi:dTDP-4-amino-4,6-dideoxy-D-galactose acyltransferase